MVNDSATVLVIGGSRGTGLLAARLLERRGVPVRVLARNPSRAAADLGPGVEVVAGDITRPDTLPAAVDGAGRIIFTAGVRSARPAGEALVRATDYGGPVHTLAAARATGMTGRFVYMTSIGIRTPSVAGRLLNAVKGNTLVWRKRVEDEIRASGLDYAILRAGFLANGPAGRREIAVSQGDLPLAPRYRIARADVAEALVESLYHPATSRVTFEVVNGRGPRRTGWVDLLDNLRPDIVTSLDDGEGT